MSGHCGALASQVDSKIHFHEGALAEYQSIRTIIDEVTEDKERIQQEREMFQQEMERLKEENEKLQHELLANGESLLAIKEGLLASNVKLSAASNAITESKEKIFQLVEEQKDLKRKLLESETKNNKLEQQCGSLIQQRGVQTRSMRKRRSQSEGPLDSGAYENEYTSQLDDQSLSHLAVETHNMQVPTRSVALSETDVRTRPVNKPTAAQISDLSVSNNEELESIRKELIKGFFAIDKGGRNLGIKEMGKLNENEFETACLEKLPPEEVDENFCNLYSSWQKQLADPSWYPFKTVTIDGNCQEILDVDDGKLQELKRIWGEGPHDAVVRALREMQEYNLLSNRSIAYEIWNYKEGRKATTTEAAEYMCNQVKQLSVTKRRKTRRAAGTA